MRYYNVYFYSSCPVEQNQESYPPYWVWKTQRCNINEEIPLGAQRMTLEELRQYKQNNKVNINSWVSQKVEFQTHADKKVKKAIKGASSLISKFCAENIVMGITQAGKTKLLADTLRDVFYYAQTGSLYECLSSLSAVQITPEMAPFLTESRKAELQQKLFNLLNTL